MICGRAADDNSRRDTSSHVRQKPTRRRLQGWVGLGEAGSHAAAARLSPRWGTGSQSLLRYAPIEAPAGGPTCLYLASAAGRLPVRR